MAFNIRFNEEKNQLLKATRGVGFEEIIREIESGNVLADIAHPGRLHLNQRLYVVVINNYAYAVPYVINDTKQEIFLKTCYPSNVLTKQYLRKRKNEKTKKV